MIVNNNIITKEEFFKKEYVKDIFNINNNYINEENIQIAYENNLIIGKGLSIVHNTIEGVIATNYSEVLKYYNNRENIIFVPDSSIMWSSFSQEKYSERASFNSGHSDPNSSKI